jgi:hypothetical protein
MGKIIRAPKGTARQVVPLEEIQVPDLWHVAERLQDAGNEQDSEQILDCWHLCIDLLAYARGNSDYHAKD